MVNLNKMARKVTLKEVGRREVSIAQVKEIMRLTLIELAKLPDDVALNVIHRYLGKK